MRSRNIKPGFFLNPDLADIPDQAKLIFIGLWCMADREGRLVEYPRKIKALLFPYDRRRDILKSLNDLQKKGFIVRYSVDGCNYIAIPTFKDHQKPHYHEVPSKLPDYQDALTSPDKSGHVALIPDPCSLIPERGKRKEVEGPSPQNLLDLYNKTAKETGLSIPQGLTPLRKIKAKQRLNEHPEESFWVGVMAKIKVSRFLKGDNDRAWKVDFDFLVANPENCLKISEGKYDGKR